MIARRPLVLKRLNAPPPALHEGVSLEGRWRVVDLFNTLLPQAPPPFLIDLEKHLFAQSGGDWALYEPAVYRVCACLKYKPLDTLSLASVLQALLEVEHVAAAPVAKANTSSNQSSTLSAAVECQIKCGRCKSTHVSVEQKQTRGADESMTVFVQCENCGLRWKMS